MVDKAATIVRAKQLRRATLADLATAIRTGNASILTLTRTTGLDVEVDRQMTTEQQMTGWARRMKSQAGVAAERLDHMTPTEDIHQLTEMSQGCMRRSILSQMLKRKAWTRSLQLVRNPPGQHPTNPLNDASRSVPSQRLGASHHAATGYSPGTNRHATTSQSLRTNHHAATGHSPETNRHAATSQSLRTNRHAATGQRPGTNPGAAVVQGHVMTNDATTREAPQAKPAQRVATDHNTVTRL